MLLNYYEMLKDIDLSPRLTKCLAAIRDPNNDLDAINRICSGHKG